ncbi:MAG TPA: hypothetical protein VHQ23_11080 [Ilumatobacteraceae bacterium]|jgi:hypothetical protein|nr:hypothetical protein [Ilumatobacteraceae bacterium]
MPSPIVHAEIRSNDPDATRAFFGVDDIDAAVLDATRLGGTIVQQPVRVPGVAFALIADPAGQVVGLAQQG